MTLGGQTAEKLVDGFAVLLVSSNAHRAWQVAVQATSYLDAHYPPGKPYERAFITPDPNSTNTEIIIHTVAARGGGVLYLQDFMDFFGDVLLYVAEARKIRLGGNAKFPNPFGLILSTKTLSGSQVETEWLQELGVGLIHHLDTGRSGATKPTPKRFTTREAWDESNDDGFDGLLDMPSFRRRR